MGLFGRKKEKTKPEIVEVSGEQLCKLLKAAVSEFAREMDERGAASAPEIMVDYKNNLHFCGVKYDKKRAKSEKRVTFSKELMTVYLDKQEFRTVDELLSGASMDGEALSSVPGGIAVPPELKDLL